MNQNENETKSVMSVWIARDDDGNLCVFEKKPMKDNIGWWAKSSRYFKLNPNLFKEVTFENSPRELQLILI